MALLTRSELDLARCQVPGCAHEHDPSELWFHSQCHPQDPVWVRYHDGVLEVICAVCYQDVAQVAVAQEREKET